MATSPVGLPPGYAVETPPATAQSSLPSGYAIESPAQQQQPQATMSSGNPQGEPDASLMTSDPLKQAGIKLTMPLVKGLLDAHSKLKEVQNLTPEGKQEHPIQAHIGDLVNKIEGLLTGNEEHPEAGIGTGKYGMLNNPVLASVMGAPEGAELATGGEAAIRGMGAAKGGAQAAEKAPGIIKQAIQGEKVAQAPAQAGLKTAAKAVGGVEKEGLRTSLAEPVDKAFTTAKSTYAKIDKASGTDFKALTDKLGEAEEKIRMAADGSAEEAQAIEARDKLNFNFELAKQKAEREGVPLSTLNEADKQWTKAQALKDVEAKIFRNPTHIEGNVAHGTPETVNIDSTIKALERLQSNTKYGAPRLEQAFDKDGASKILDDLYAAQRLGVKAAGKQEVAKVFAKWAARVAGVGLGYEVLK